MKLRLQFIIFISLLVILQLIGLSYINIVNARIAAIEQLTASAQNTADALGFSLKKHLQDNNPAMVITSTRAVFDSGHYQSIRVLDNTQTAIAEFKQTAAPADSVPSWFISLINITPPKAQTNLMKNWQILGKIIVKPSPNYIYIELWRSVSRESLWLLVLAVVFTALLLFLLHLILRPLYRSKDQAEAIMLGEFETQLETPNTYEFKILVNAMNNMANRLQMLFARHAATTQYLQQQAYQDSLTGLANVSFYRLKMSYLMSERDEFIYGSFLHADFICEDKTTRIEAIQAFSKIVDDCLDRNFGGFAARLDQDTVAIHMPFVNIHHAKTQAQQWCEALEALYGDTITISIGITGLAGYWHNETLVDLLVNTDMLVKRARASGNYKIAADMLTLHDSDIILADCLNDALNEQAIALISHPVVSIDSQTTRHHLARLAIDTDTMTIVTARGLMAAAIEIQRATELDEFVLNYILEHDSDIAHAHTLSRISVSTPGFIEQLEKRLSAHPNAHQQLLIDITEYCALTYPKDAKALAECARGHRVPFGLMQVGREFHDFEHFKTLKPDFIRLNGTYSHMIDKHPENQAFVREVVYICHTLGIQVHASAVSRDEEITILAQLGVDAMIVRAEGIDE